MASSSSTFSSGCWGELLLLGSVCCAEGHQSRAEPLLPTAGQGKGGPCTVQTINRSHLGTGLLAIGETEPDTAVQEHLRVTNKLKHLEAELGSSALSNGIQVCHCLVMGTPGTRWLSQQVTNEVGASQPGTLEHRGTGCSPQTLLNRTISVSVPVGMPSLGTLHCAQLREELPPAQELAHVLLSGATAALHG